MKPSIRYSSDWCNFQCLREGTATSDAFEALPKDLEVFQFSMPPEKALLHEAIRLHDYLSEFQFSMPPRRHCYLSLLCQHAIPCFNSDCLREGTAKLHPLMTSGGSGRVSILNASEKALLHNFHVFSLFVPGRFNSRCLREGTATTQRYRL